MCPGSVIFKSLPPEAWQYRERCHTERGPSKSEAGRGGGGEKGGVFGEIQTDNDSLIQHPHNR